MTEAPAPRGAERRIGRQIQHEVMQLILDRGLRPGEPLPTESDLVDDLGVSRNSIREALKALQALDIVEIRHGHGTYVGQVSLTPLADGLTFRTLQEVRDVSGLAEILQVREVLEAGLIGRVVLEATDADLAELDAVVRRMDADAKAGRSLAEADREFHELLYRPLGNSLVPQLLGVFWNVFHRVADIRGWDDEPAPAGTVRRHRAIVNALRKRDVAAAQEALAKHFRSIDTRVDRAGRRARKAR